MAKPALTALLIVAGAAALAACRTTYVAPPARELPPVDDTDWTKADRGDAPTIRVAESKCLSKLSPRAVASAFRAVDEVADALLEMCSIGIVNDDPLVWHVWCGSDALFDSGFYLPPEGEGVSCEGRPADSAFECMGRILTRHLLSQEMTAHVRGVELVSLGSVDRQPINMSGQFANDPCTELQAELGLPADRRWERHEEGAEAEVSRAQWNRRLSWCRAAHSALQLRQGMSSSGAGRVQIAAIGAGTDWLDHYTEGHRGRLCPTPPAVSGERQSGQCRDARRVDVFIRVRAEEGSASAAECSTPAGLRGGESGEALYCYAQCSARAAVGRNPHGYRAPSSPANLLFGHTMGQGPDNWIVQSTGRRPVNLLSVRSLFFAE